jgi:hypothetical protein
MKSPILAGIIGGLLLTIILLIGSVEAISSVDLVLTPNHISPVFSPQPPLYDFGEPVLVNVTLINRGPGPITIIGYPPRTGISYRNQQDFRTFKRSCETLVLGTDQSTSFPVIWDQNDEHGKPVDPGLYTIVVYFLLTENGNGSYDLSHLKPYSRTVDVIVLPESGALTADIPVNLTQVIDNVSVTLESINLTNTTGQVHVTFQVPEDIPYQTHPTGWKMCYLDFISVEAQYTIDHLIPRQLSDPGVNCYPPHSFQSVYELDPVPADAQELEINLTVSGSHRGSRIFHVNLTPYSASSGKSSGSSYPLSPSRPAPVPVTVAILAIGCVCIFSTIQRRDRK